MEERQALLAAHGLLIVALAVLLDQSGIPIPAPPTLILAGGLIGSGDLAAWIGWKAWNRQRFLRALRMMRIEPDALRSPKIETSFSIALDRTKRRAPVWHSS